MHLLSVVRSCRINSAFISSGEGVRVVMVSHTFDQIQTH